MNFNKSFLSPLFAGLLLVAGVTAPSAREAGTAPQVLVTVGDRDITSAQLEQAIQSSPITTAFNTLGEEEQADIRGRMLKDLIYSEMLYQEALARKIDQRPEVMAELESFRLGLLYQSYLNSLRHSLDGDTAVDTAAGRHLQGEPANPAAMRSATRAENFSGLKRHRLLELGREEHLQVFRDLLLSGKRRADAVVARGDHLILRLGDLLHGGEELNGVQRMALLRRLDRQVEQRLMAMAAEREGMDVSAQVVDYRRDLLRQTLMEEKERAWVPDYATLENYYRSHPGLSEIPEQWHVAQLVSGSREEAEELRRRIAAGESLYRLATEYSIDPYGREHAGDMGWLRPDQAPPVLRDTLAELPEGVLSPVIETPMGFHLVVITGRKPAERKALETVADGTRRSLILDHLAQDYQALSQRYPIQWHLPEHRP